MTRIKCGHCGEILDVECSGKLCKILCPHCNTPITVRGFGNAEN